MGICRFFFGMGEAGAFPIATRSLSQWMLPTERGFAQGIDSRGLTPGRGLNPATGRDDDAPLRMAAPFFIFGPHRAGLGGALVLVLPRHAAAAFPINAAERESDRKSIGPARCQRAQQFHGGEFSAVLHCGLCP